jgi:Leucine-rich repeat (LRR) protein
MESHLYTYLLLPEGDEKHMPPKGKQQLDKAEIRIIGWWIHENMPLDKTVAQFVLHDTIKTALKKFSEGEKEPTGIFAKKVKAAEPAKLLALRDKGIKAQPIAKGVNYLQVSLAAGKDTFGLKEVKALGDITEQLAWLNLNRKKVNPDALSALSLFPNISRLYLANTDIRDEMLKEIARLRNLEYLNIYGTEVTDKGLSNLHSLKELRSLYLWHTKVTTEAATKLKTSIPQLNVYLGEDQPMLVNDSLK